MNKQFHDYIDEMIITYDKDLTKGPLSEDNKIKISIVKFKDLERKKNKNK